MPENKAKDGRLGIYLPETTIKKLKVLGVEEDKPVNDLMKEALEYWWKAHHEKTRGVLFPEETQATTPTKEK